MGSVVGQSLRASTSSGVWAGLRSSVELLGDSGDRNDFSLGRQPGSFVLPDTRGGPCSYEELIQDHTKRRWHTYMQCRFQSPSQGEEPHIRKT